MAAFRRPHGSTVFLILLSLVWGGFVGYGLGAYLDGGSLLRLLPALAALVAAALVQLLLHEGGHLVFGLATGYRLASFRVVSVIWLKTEAGIRRKKYQLAGTLGQCLMDPPAMAGGNFPVLLYNFGGVLMNLLTALAALPLAFGLGLGTVGGFSAWVFALVGIFFALQNGIPLSYGGMRNDGSNALLLRKDPAARRSFWLQLAINGEMTRGKRSKDMPEDWFPLPSLEEMKEPMTAAVGALACGRLMDRHDFAKAEEVITGYLAADTAIMEIHRCILVCDLLCCRLLSGQVEEAGRLLTKNQEKWMDLLDPYPAIYRTRYFWALLGQQDRKEAAAWEADLTALAKTFPYPGEMAGELEFLALAQQKKEEIV